MKILFTLGSLRPIALLPLTAAIALQITPGAYAQSEPERSRPHPPMDEARRGQPGGQPGFRGSPGQGMFVMEQVLTEDQRDSMRQTMEAQREKMRGLQEKIRDARKALMTAALVEEFKDDVVKAKAEAVVKLEVEVSVRRLKALAEVQPALSHEQLEKILNQPQPQGMGPDDAGGRPARRQGNRPPSQDAP